MTNCVVCGRELRGDEQVCPECGHPVERENGGTDIAAADDSVDQQDTAWTNGASAATENGNGAHVVGRLTVQLVRRTDDSQPREYALDGRPIYIGRSPSCDIVLDGDQLTSRRHALLRYDSARYVLVDLGSSNGTYINDNEVREATPLEDGDRVVIGEHELVYSTAAASADASLPGFAWAPTPQQPPSETNPSLAAVGSEVSNGASVPFAVATVDYGQANGSDEDPGIESATQEYPAVHVDVAPWPGDEWSAPAQQQQPSESAAEMATPESGFTDEPVEQAAQDEPVAEAEQAAQDEPVAEVAPAAEYTPVAQNLQNAPAGASYPQAGDVDLEAMHAQLAQLTTASETLARRMEEQGRQGERRKAAIQEARTQVESLLTQLDQAEETSNGNGDSSQYDLNALIDVTRQAAENPQHLQYLTRLAEHAGEIADALQQEQQRPPATAATPESIRQALEALRSQLESLN